MPTRHGCRSPGADPGVELRRTARLDLIEHVRAGALRVVVDRVFALSDVTRAHRAVLTGRTRGKIVLASRPASPTVG